MLLTQCLLATRKSRRGGGLVLPTQVMSLPNLNEKTTIVAQDLQNDHLDNAFGLDLFVQQIICLNLCAESDSAVQGSSMF